MIKHARTNGIRNNRVGVDGGYGEETDFLRGLDSRGEIFMADIHRYQLIYLENPEPTIPESRSNRSRKPTKLKAQTDPIRETTQGTLYAHMLQERVRVWDGGRRGALLAFNRKTGNLLV